MDKKNIKKDLPDGDIHYGCNWLCIVFVKR